MTERCLRYREAIEMLRNAGYVVFGRPRSRPPVVFTRFVVACNLIGELTGVDPYRVYQSITCRVEWLSRGRPHNAVNSGYLRAQGPQDAEDIHVWCPHCGADLLSAGPVGPSEIADGMTKTAAMRGRSPQKSPHSSQNEGKVLPSVGNENAETGKVAGVRGTGGCDPTGAPLPSVLPHSPLT